MSWRAVVINPETGETRIVPLRFTSPVDGFFERPGEAPGRYDPLSLCRLVHVAQPPQNIAWYMPDPARSAR